MERQLDNAPRHHRARARQAVRGQGSPEVGGDAAPLVGEPGAVDSDGPHPRRRSCCAPRGAGRRRGAGKFTGNPTPRPGRGGHPWTSSLLVEEAEDFPVPRQRQP